MSTKRYSDGAARVPLEYHETGVALCRWCKHPVPPPKKTFCSPECVIEWRLRTQPNFLRKMVLARDAGVCSVCGLDTQLLSRKLRAARRMSVDAYNDLCAEHGLTPQEGGRALWEAHHVLAVSEGGGEAGLENLVTLCRICHKAASAIQAQRRRR